MELEILGGTYKIPLKLMGSCSGIGQKEIG
jgi:hypothetical protein